MKKTRKVVDGTCVSEFACEYCRQHQIQKKYGKHMQVELMYVKMKVVLLNIWENGHIVELY